MGSCGAAGRQESLPGSVGRKCINAKAECLFALNPDPELTRDIKDGNSLNLCQPRITHYARP